MKLTKEQLNLRFDDSFWVKKYIQILSIEENNEEDIVRALQMTELPDAEEKISSLFHNRTKIVINRGSDNTYQTIIRPRATFQPPRPGNIYVAPRDPFVVGGDTEGSGELSGEGYVELIASGDAIGAGTMTGAPYLEFVGGGDTEGSGALDGGYSMVFLNTSGDTEGSGTLDGDAYIELLASGDTTGAGSLDGGYTYLDLPASGDTEGSGTLEGNASVVEDVSETVTGSYYENIIQSYVSASDLIAHYGASDERTGTYNSVLYDTGSNAYDSVSVSGTPTINHAAFTAFRGGSNLLLASSTEFYNLETNASDRFDKFMYEDPSTFMAWINIYDATIDHNIITTKNDSTSATGMALWFDEAAGNPTLYLRIGNGTTSYDATEGRFGPNDWETPVFVAGTLDENNDVKLYINGELADTVVYTPPAGATAERPLRIGSDGVSPNASVIIDELTFLSGALSGNIVREIFLKSVPSLYNAGHLSDIGIKDSCIQYLSNNPFNPANIDYDISLNENSASLVSFPNEAFGIIDNYHFNSLGRAQSGDYVSSSYVPSFTGSFTIAGTFAGITPTGVDDGYSFFSIGTTGSCHISLTNNSVGADEYVLEAYDGTTYKRGIYASSLDQASVVLRYQSGSTLDAFIGFPPTSIGAADDYGTGSAISIDISDMNLSVTEPNEFLMLGLAMSGAGQVRIDDMQNINLSHRGTYDTALTDYECYRLSRWNPVAKFEWDYRRLVWDSSGLRPSVGGAIDVWTSDITFPINSTNQYDVNGFAGDPGNEPTLGSGSIEFASGSTQMCEADPLLEDSMYLSEKESTTLMWISSSNSTNDMTILHWQDLTNTAFDPMVKARVTGSDFIVEIHSSDNNSDDQIGSASYTPGEWSLVGYILDPVDGTFRVIGDGIVATSSYSLPSAWNLQTGNNIDGFLGSTLGTSNYFDGGIKYIAYHEYTVSAEEIASLSSSGPPTGTL